MNKRNTIILISVALSSFLVLVVVVVYRDGIIKFFTGEDSEETSSSTGIPTVDISQARNVLNTQANTPPPKATPPTTTSANTTPKTTTSANTTPANTSTATPQANEKSKWSKLATWLIYSGVSVLAASVVGVAGYYYFGL